MKNASWFFALLLGALLFYACGQLPFPGDASSNLSSHLSLRYTQQSRIETGIQSPAGAVLADYRGFDLLTAGLLFFAAALSLFLFYPGSPWLGAWFPAFLVMAGPATALGLGFLSLPHGSNFLDYEALASWVASPGARVDGALILTGAVLLGSGGVLLLAIRWIQTPEGPGER